MSLSAEERPPPRRDAARAGSRESASQGDEVPRGALPIRLSVSQGGLGIELSRTRSLGVAQVNAFEVTLLGIQYPVDLSRGVKQFRNRRSRLARLAVSVDLPQVAGLWARCIEEWWGEPVSVTIRPVLQELDPNAVDGQAGVVALAITVTSHEAVLAFDLVVASGTAPCFVVDAPRSWGGLKAVQENTALGLALRVSDSVLSIHKQGLTLSRTGRLLHLEGLAEVISLALLPELGCRLPDVTGQVIVGLGCEGGRLSLELGLRGEPFASTRRAMRVFAAAQVSRTADERLAQGDFDGARRAYLEILHIAPGHPEVLLDLAELDLTTGFRFESALSFLEEADSSGTEQSSGPSSVRQQVAWFRALLGTGRPDSALESLKRAGQWESEGTLAGLLLLELASRSIDEPKRRAWLDAAVSRAPSLSKIREARLQFCLKSGDDKTAQSDAEHLEAAQANDEGRARVCLLVGRACLGVGKPGRAEQWFRRALRFRPSDAEVKILLARGLVLGDAPVRAAELLGAALEDIGAELSRLSPLDGGEVERLEFLQEQKAKAHLELAKILIKSEGDVPGALAQLARVPMRAGVGKEARLMEARLHHEAKRAEQRDRVLFRLLEAVELSWLPPGSLLQELSPYLEASAGTGDRALVDFARRVLPTSDAG